MPAPQHVNPGMDTTINSIIINDSFRQAVASERASLQAEHDAAVLDMIAAVDRVNALKMRMQEVEGR